MKKIRFVFIAVALIALLSAFATNKKTTTYTFTRTGSVFSISGVEYVPVFDISEYDYDCIFYSYAECTFESVEQASSRSGILSISKAGWNVRGNITYGICQLW
jgi:hypothetical protein